MTDIMFEVCLRYLRYDDHTTCVGPSYLAFMLRPRQQGKVVLITLATCPEYSVATRELLLIFLLVILQLAVSVSWVSF